MSFHIKQFGKHFFYLEEEEGAFVYCLAILALLDKTNKCTQRIKKLFFVIKLIIQRPSSEKKFHYILREWESSSIRIEGRFLGRLLKSGTMQKLLACLQDQLIYIYISGVYLNACMHQYKRPQFTQNRLYFTPDLGRKGSIFGLEKHGGRRRVNFGRKYPTSKEEKSMHDGSQ